MEVREPNARYLVAQRRTELGELPVDWRVVPIGALYPFITSGSRGWARYYAESGFTFLRITNLSRECIYPSLYDLKYVSVPPGDSEGFRTALEAGDILISITADIGMVGVVTSAIERPAYVNQHIALVRIAKEQANSQYLAYFLAGAASQLRFKAMTDAGAKAGMSLTGVRQELVAFPPTDAEQQAIAEALSDADALIGSLSLLLAKKRQIKQGAMQELLAGKRRLPGFGEEWSEKSLGDLFQFSGGLSASRDQLSTRGHLYLHYGDIHTSAKSFIDVEGQGSSIPRLDVPFAKIQPAAVLADGDVVFVDASEDDDGVSKHVVVVNPEGVPFIAGLHTIVAKQKRAELNSTYLRYCFQTRAVKEQFKFYAVGTKVSGISKRNIAKIVLHIPPREEQSVIAEMLVSIDQDIAALEVKHSKVRQLKQATMQAPLTGRIRLVQPASNVIPLPVKPPSTNTPPQSAHNWQINEAVVIGMLAQRFGTEKFPLPRKRRVKLMYLLHRHAEGRAEGYLKKAAGPYDPNTKYKGPEGIALKNGYVRAVHNGTYEGFVAGDKSDQSQRYFEQWYGMASLDWLERFHYRKTDDLELLATVDMAMVDLADGDQPVNVAGVKRIIAAHPEWLPKLSRELFSDDHIASAIAECATLFPA